MTEKVPVKKTLIVFSVVLFSLFILPDCKKVIDQILPAFNFSISDIQATIPIIPLANASTTISKAKYFNLDSTVKAKTAGAFNSSDIRFIKVKNIAISLQNADEFNNAANFKSISISLYSNTNTLPVNIISAAIPDSASNTLSLTPGNSPDLMPYLQGNEITYIITGTTRRATIHELIATADITLTVK